MHIMSDEEIQESNRKIEDWWSDLEHHLKLHLYKTNKIHFEQMVCSHKFKTNDNIDFEYCDICNLHKAK